MDTAWIGSISALLGVAVGAFAEAWRGRSVFRREKAWELNQEQQRRLEQLYEALEEVRESYTLASGEMLLFIGTQQRPKRETARAKVPWAKLRMLVNLYAPDLQETLADVNVAGEKMGGALGAAVVEGSRDKSHDQHLLETLNTAYRDLDNAVEGMRTAIVASSRSLSERAAAGSDKRLRSA